jgi:hypothetical protein
MKQQGESRLANAAQRMLALLVFVVLGIMVWLAHSGRFDRQVNQVAHWMQHHYDALLH